MKKCTNCDRESMDEVKFCQSCGAKFPDEAKTPTVIVANNTQGDENSAPPLPDVSGYSSGESVSPPPPNNGLVWLIISSILTFLGCFCYGVGLLQIPTIITSAISVSKYNRGDYEGSKRLAKTSMILFFSILAFSILVIVGVLVWAFSVVGMSGFGDITDIVDEFY